MTTTRFSSLDSGQRWSLAALALAPLLVLVAARLLGLMALVRLGVMGLVGAAFLAVVFARPRWGVYFMAFYVYSALFFYVPGVVSVAVVAVLGLVAVMELFAGEKDHVTDRVFLGFTALLILFSLHSAVVAQYPERSVAAMMAMVKTLALTLLIVHFVRTVEDLRHLVLAVFVGAIATIIFGVINLKLGLYTEDNVIRGAGLFRFSGTHEDPNEAAGIMCAAIPLGIYLLRHYSNRWMRILTLAGILVLVVGTFSTFSRSAIFAFAVVTVAVVGREVRTRGGYLSILALLVVGILVTPGYYWVRLLELRETVTSNVNQDFSVVLRLEAMETAWRLFLANPWAGIGLDNFIPRGALGVIRRIVVHNTYLEVLVSVGVFGFIAYLGVFASGLRHSLAGMRDRTAGSDLRSLSFYLGLSLVSIMTSATFLTIIFKYPLWIPLAMTLVLGNLLRESPQQNVRNSRPTGV